MSLTSINVNNTLVTRVDSEPTAGSDNLVKSGGVAIHAAPGGINLLNKSTITDGKYLQPDNGVIHDIAGTYLSDYIYVKGMSTVTFTAIGMSNYGGYILYDKDKKRISFGANASRGIVIGQAVYLRVNGDTNNLYKDMVIEGNNMPNVYVPYTNCDKVSLYDIESKLHLEQTNIPTVEKLQLIPTTYESGIFGNENIYYSTSNYIEISPNVKCYYLYFQKTSTNIPKIIFYDKDKKVIDILIWQDLNDYIGKILKFVFPKGCQYVRYSKLNGNMDGIYTCEVSNIEDDIISVVEKKDYIVEQTNPPITQNLELIPTTFEEGIFGYTNQFYKTSDYIEVSLGVKAYYLYFQEPFGNTIKVVFYDKNKKSIKGLVGQDLNEYVGNILKINLPINCKYIRYSRLKYVDYDGLYTCKVSTIEKDFIGMLYKHYTDTNNILWVGTSIPEGATYPQVSAAACGYNCIKKAKGAQSLSIRISNPLCMMYTQQEFYDNFHSEIGSSMSQDEYNNYIDFTFERNVLPFVRGAAMTVNDGNGERTINPDNIKVSAVVIDHNHNDYANITKLLQDEEHINWESRDRTNFVGALNYLLDEIRYINPTIKIVLAGYFQNSWLIGGTADVCKMASLCAEHLNLEIMKTWEYSQINNKIIKGTSNYIADFNATYGTSYVVPEDAMDSQGNISAQYIYLPDGIHPHSDLTQNCNHRLDAIYSKLLKNII